MSWLLAALILGAFAAALWLLLSRRRASM